MAEESYVNQADLRMALRAELAELELRLLDKLVTKAEHDSLVTSHGALVQRVGVIESHGSPHVTEVSEKVAINTERISALEAWRNRMQGVWLIVAFQIPVIATISWHIWG